MGGIKRKTVMPPLTSFGCTARFCRGVERCRETDEVKSSCPRYSIVVYGIGGAIVLFSERVDGGRKCDHTHTTSS